MSGKLVTFSPTTDVLDAIHELVQRRIAGAPVVDDHAKTVDAGMSIVDLAKLFIATRYRRFPELKDNRLIGRISRRDVLRALAEIASP